MSRYQFRWTETPTLTGKARNKAYKKGHWSELRKVDIEIQVIDTRISQWDHERREERVQACGWWRGLNEGKTERSAAPRHRAKAECIVQALTTLFARSENPSIRKIAAFVAKHDGAYLPGRPGRRYGRAVKFTGAKKDVLDLHGLDGIAAAIVREDPGAIAFRARLTERELVMVDQAIEGVPHAA